MILYLKGMFGRNEEGWTIPKANCDDAKLRDEYPPKFVKCVPRLKCDIAALIELTAKDSPQDTVWVTNPIAIYLVGNTSGQVFGSCSWFQGAKKMRVNLWTWTP